MVRASVWMRTGTRAKTEVRTEVRMTMRMGARVKAEWVVSIYLAVINK
jgi:hypothetical protein